MKLIFALVASLIAASAAFADRAPAGEIDTDSGRIIVNGQKLQVIRKYDGRQVDLVSEHIIASAGKNPGLFISFYRDKASPSEKTRTEHFIIIDATGNEVRRSNVLDAGTEFDWGDNNYVRFEGNAMYFGIYAPKRMQFFYRDGTLAEDKGPWRGPAKPEKYIEPTGNDPCGNVNGVDDCRAEVARDKARHHKSKTKDSRQRSSTAQ